MKLSTNPCWIASAVQDCSNENHIFLDRIKYCEREASG